MPMNADVRHASASSRLRRHAPGPSALYGVRNVARFAADPLRFLRELIDAHGDVAKLLLLGKPYFVISHPDLIEAALVKHARVMGRDEYVVVLERALGKGLLTSEGELWKRQRKLMSQAFVTRRIHSYGEAMVRVTARATGAWRDSQVLNLHREISRVTMEVVADVLFGAEIAPDDLRLVSDSLEIINDLFANSPEVLTRLPAWVPTPRNVRTQHAVTRIDALLYRIIAARRGAPPRDDLLGTLLSGAVLFRCDLRSEIGTA